MNKKQFGKKLLFLRKARNLTQEELCANADGRLTVPAYSKIERGLSVPKLDTLDLITDALGLPYDFLYIDYIPLINERHSLVRFVIRCIEKGNYPMVLQLFRDSVRLIDNERVSVDQTDDVQLVFQLFDEAFSLKAKGLIRESVQKLIQAGALSRLLDLRDECIELTSLIVETIAEHGITLDPAEIFVIKSLIRYDIFESD